MYEVLLQFGEISIKGKNKFDFVRQLTINIKILARKHNISLSEILVKRDRILVKIEGSKEEIISMFKKMPGISSFYFVQTIPSNYEDIKTCVADLLSQTNFNENSFVLSIKTQRSDKSFPLTSPQINANIASFAKKKGIPVDLKFGDKTLYIKITSTKTYISFEKYVGLDGLPIRSTGKVLCLLSGGIDSPVAAYTMMKRGLHIDYLHVHALRSNQEVLNSPLKETIEQLNLYQGKAKLYTLPNHFFEFSLNSLRYKNYEVVIFKHFLLHLAQKIAQEKGYDAILTGDSLAQVASQTLDNMTTTSQGITTTLLRPLISYNKEEIITLGKNIGTYDFSIQKYKDCCSLLSKKPTTKASKEKFETVLEDINLSAIIEESKKEMEKFSIY